MMRTRYQQTPADYNKKRNFQEAWLDGQPGLREALACPHKIVQDIAKKFRQYGPLSEAQTALVLKLDGEWKARASEPTVPAPEGKQTFVGTVLSAKWYSGRFGDSLKFTVKVFEGAGYWLAWGTVPAAIANEAGRIEGELKGAKVELTADLKRGNDAHFALMSRPRGQVLAFMQAG
jgi:hypothetical protein